MMLFNNTTKKFYDKPIRDIVNDFLWSKFNKNVINALPKLLVFVGHKEGLNSATGRIGYKNLKSIEDELRSQSKWINYEDGL